jgi:hypothetical protein
VSLVLTLDEFAYSEDLTAFNNEMRSASDGVLPVWQDESPKGKYWFEISEEPKTVVRSLNLAEWEKIVTQIAARPDFLNENTYYTMEGIHRVGRESLVSLHNGAYTLAPGQEYEVCLYQFHPTKAPTGSMLRVETVGKSLRFTTSQNLILDSRYDLKRVRIRTNSPPSREATILTILRNERDQVGPTLDFDLRIEINGVFWKTLGYGCVLGLLLATPPVISALSNPSLPALNVTEISVGSGVVGLFTGIFAAFGLKTGV